MAYPIQSLANGMVRYSDGSIRPAPTPTPTQNRSSVPTPIPTPTKPWNFPSIVPKAQASGQVLGASTQYPMSMEVMSKATSPADFGGVSYADGGGGGGGGTPPPQPTAPTGGGNSSELDALNAWIQNQKQMIADAWNAKKAQAQTELGRGKGIFDNTLSAVGKYRDRAKEAFSNAGQEITDTASNLYGTNWQNNQEQTGNLVNHFAGANIGKSAQAQIAAKLAEALTKSQGSVASEAGRNNRENTLQYNQRGDQASNWENDARTQLQYATDSANNLERAGLDQYGTDVVGAGNSFQSMINDMIARNQQLALLKAQIPDQVSNYTPSLGVTDYLNGLFKQQGGAGGSFGGQDVAANVTAPTTYEELLKRQRGLV